MDKTKRGGEQGERHDKRTGLIHSRTTYARVSRGSHVLGPGDLLKIEPGSGLDRGAVRTGVDNGGPSNMVMPEARRI